MSLQETINIASQELIDFQKDGDVHSVADKINEIAIRLSEDEEEYDAIMEALDQVADINQGTSAGSRNDKRYKKSVRDNLNERFSNGGNKPSTATLEKPPNTNLPPNKPLLSTTPPLTPPKIPTSGLVKTATPGAAKAVATTSTAVGGELGGNLSKSALGLNALQRASRVKEAAKNGGPEAAKEQAAKEAVGYAKDLAVQKLVQAAAKSAVAFVTNPAVLPIIAGIALGIMLIMIIAVGAGAAVTHIFCTPLQIEKFVLQQVLDDGVEQTIESLCGASACGGSASIAAGGVGFDCQSNRIIIGSRFNFVDVRFIPPEQNIYYALSMLKSQEFNGAQYTESFVGGDRDSCGPYQQRMREIVDGQKGALAQAARRITGSKPITSCKQVIEDYGFGFFDQLAIERLKLEGVYDDLLTKNLSDPNQLRQAAVLLCNSQRPDAYNVRERSCPSNSYYVNNIFDAGEQLVANNQYQKTKTGCSGGENVAKVKARLVNGKIDLNYAKQFILGVDASAETGVEILNGTYKYTLNGNRVAGTPNSVRGGVLKHNDHVPEFGPIHSPFNGVVVGVIDSFPNNNGRWGLSTADFGNQVLIRITDGPNAGRTFGIGHIDQGSPVKVGDQIVVGQNIGALTKNGGSGSGTGPHFSTIVMDGEQTRMIDSRANIAATAQIANLVITGDGTTASSVLGESNGTGTASGGCAPVGLNASSTLADGSFDSAGAYALVKEFVDNYSFNSAVQNAGLTSGQISALQGGNKGCAFVTSEIISLISSPDFAKSLYTLGANDQLSRARAAGGTVITDASQTRNFTLVTYGSPAGHTGIILRDPNGNLVEVSNRSSLKRPAFNGSPADAVRLYSGTYGQEVTMVTF